jgi:hypothetical protein
VWSTGASNCSSTPVSTLGRFMFPLRGVHRERGQRALELEELGGVQGPSRARPRWMILGCRPRSELRTAAQLLF